MSAKQAAAAAASKKLRLCEDVKKGMNESLCYNHHHPKALTHYLWSSCVPPLVCMYLGVQVLNLEEVACTAPGDMIALLKRGVQQRATAETLCNKQSSRSHSVFTIKIVIKVSQ